MIASIPPADYQRARERGDAVCVLDVRNADEIAFAPFPDAVWIPLPELESRVAELDAMRGQMIVTLCHHGRRAERAAGILMQNGFDRVSVLEGGIDAWSLMVDPSVPRY